MRGIQANLENVLLEITKAAEKAKRDPAKVTLVAVSKTVEPARLMEAIEAGVGDLGENRVQEWLAKREAVRGVRWHLIGHLQSNKAGQVVDGICLLHSLDRLSLAEALSRRAVAAGTVQSVLVQVNLLGQPGRFGLTGEEVGPFLEQVAGLQGIKVRGLMGMAPPVSTPEEARPYFRRLRLLAEALGENPPPGVELKELSMGMSGDYPVAVEEGATLVRVGSAIFGLRG